MPSQVTDVTIVGAGLAGVECAAQIIAGGYSVCLIDGKPDCFGPYVLPGFAELVCSNSLKSDDVSTASGLLKAEMRLFDCLLLDVADLIKLRAGGAVAVDRVVFSERVTRRLRTHPNVQVRQEHVTTIPEGSTYKVIATGPLTRDPLAAELGAGDLHFFDATAPIVSVDTIDKTQVFAAGRYDKGGADYLNCPLDQANYARFHAALCSADVVEMNAYDDRVFAHCQAVERIAKSGLHTLRYGPFRPTGLIDPATGKRPFAVLQLRREDAGGKMWGLVGCQTRLTFPEQGRVFRLIPALAKAEFFRYGVMHRNSYVDGPRVLTYGNEMKTRPGVFVAGQLTGVEGYMESAASGLITGRYIRHLLDGKTRPEAAALLPPATTMIGALHDYVTKSVSQDYQPMNANFGLFAPTPDTPAKKRVRRAFYAERSRQTIQALLESNHA